MPIFASETSRGNRICSSIMAAFMTIQVVNPLDVIRVRLQNMGSKNIQMAVKDCTTCSGLRQNSLKVLGSVIKSEGPATLWAGALTAMYAAIPSTMIYFTMYDELKMTFGKTNLPTFFVPAVAGGLARIVTTTAVSPFELIRTRLQAEGNIGMMNIIKEEAKRGGLWRGFLPTLYRDVPFSVLYWTSYEAIRPLLGEKQQQSSGKRGLASFLTGCSAGSLSAIITHPVDIIKTRRQSTAGGPTSTAVLTRQLMKEGVRGLTAGLGPRLLKISVACGLMISCYDTLKGILVKKDVEETITKM
eukprot:TRINITY_DN406_c2_g1_i1.p1 TRINITY_DN406_c2_g1~~TRINITY_DN406_c2_g1_i1.p1  ORF type:complete len:301 (+),score=71.49 TRINITY_DN406_c2_g1_i1:100-1002(+)